MGLRFVNVLQVVASLRQTALATDDEQYSHLLHALDDYVSDTYSTEEKPAARSLAESPDLRPFASVPEPPRATRSHSASFSRYEAVPRETEYHQRAPASDEALYSDVGATRYEQPEYVPPDYPEQRYGRSYEDDVKERPSYVTSGSGVDPPTSEQGKERLPRRPAPNVEIKYETRNGHERSESPIRRDDASLPDKQNYPPASRADYSHRSQPQYRPPPPLPRRHDAPAVSKNRPPSTRENYPPSAQEHARGPTRQDKPPHRPSQTAHKEYPPSSPEGYPHPPHPGYNHSPPPPPPPSSRSRGSYEPTDDLSPTSRVKAAAASLETSPVAQIYGRGQPPRDLYRAGARPVKRPPLDYLDRRVGSLPPAEGRKHTEGRTDYEPRKEDKIAGMSSVVLAKNVNK